MESITNNPQAILFFAVLLIVGITMIFKGAKEGTYQETDFNDQENQTAMRSQHYNRHANYRQYDYDDYYGPSRNMGLSQLIELFRLRRQTAVLKFILIIVFIAGLWLFLSNYKTTEIVDTPYTPPAVEDQINDDETPFIPFDETDSEIAPHTYDDEYNSAAVGEDYDELPRINQPPSHQLTDVEVPEQVPTPAASYEETSIPLHYFQISTADDFDGLSHALREYGPRFPGQVQVARSLLNERFYLKILVGPFASEAAARAAAASNGKGFYVNVIDKGYEMIPLEQIATQN